MILRDVGLSLIHVTSILCFFKGARTQSQSCGLSYMASSWLPDSILTPDHSPVARLLQDSDKDGHVSFDEFIHYVGKLGEGIGIRQRFGTGWVWSPYSASSIFKLSQLVPQMMQSSLAVDSYIFLLLCLASFKVEAS